MIYVHPTHGFRWAGRSIGLAVLGAALVSSACAPGRGEPTSGIRDARHFEEMKTDRAVNLAPSGAELREKGELRPCEEGSRSDGWGEVTRTFRTNDSADDIARFYRSRLPGLGWLEMKSHDYGPSTLVFAKTSGRHPYQLRIVGWDSPADGYFLILETRPVRRCAGTE